MIKDKARIGKRAPKKPKIVVVAGGFDPIHIGHIRHFKEAKKLGDELVVLLASDKDMAAKKGRSFMPFHERKEVLESIKYVDKVLGRVDKDGTVAKTLEKLKPHIFAKGGDRIPGNMPPNEIDVCAKHGISVVYGVGGEEKVQSSSKLTGLYAIADKKAQDK